tara:strand:+ start:339928 stop:340962 length:1035 start_codon:yes stop_codon:yes gene_type:complete
MSKENTPSEEVDLGNLFQIIGKGFKNLFNGIGQLFKALFHYLILFLLFLRNNALKLGLAALIGGGIGLYLDLTKSKTYVATMIVEPNFKSTQQLYNDIDFYHELVKQKDSNLLAETLNITKAEAAKLKGFYIEPIKNENEKLELFNDFIEEVDTTTVKNIDIREFKRGFTDYDYRYHKILVRSEQSGIFPKISQPIISSVEDNGYFKNQKKINTINLTQNEDLLKKSLIEVDTLRKVYNQVLLAEANKIEQGTSISLAEGSRRTDEIELFNESLKLNKELIDNNTEKAQTTEILNVVSSFSRVGVKEREVFKKYTVQLAGFFFGLMFLFILGKQLNSYLLNYRK